MEELSDRETLVKKVTIVRWRSSSATSPPVPSPKGSGCRRARCSSGPSLEYSYKDDSLGDPMINDSHILALGIATKDDLDTISKYAFKVNEVLKSTC